MKYDDVMKLALERGFYFPSCEVYSDAQAGFWEYGPAGVSLKNKFLELWRRELVRRDKMIEIDGSQIMSKSVFEASGHLSSFADPIVRCTKCKSTYRADKIIVDATETSIPESADLGEFDKVINEKNVKDTFEKFDKEIGLKHLKILHLNDSKGELGSHLDRHDHIGLGQIGNAGLSKGIKLMNKNKIPIILETPIDDRRDEFGDIGTAKELA